MAGRGEQDAFHAHGHGGQRSKRSHRADPHVPRSGLSQTHGQAHGQQMSHGHGADGNGYGREVVSAGSSSRPQPPGAPHDTSLANIPLRGSGGSYGALPSDRPQPTDRSQPRSASRTGSMPLESPSGRLGASASLKSIKHYASLLIAEKPLEAHRAYQKKGGSMPVVEEDGNDAAFNSMLNSIHSPVQTHEAPPTDDEMNPDVPRRTLTPPGRDDKFELTEVVTPVPPDTAGAAVAPDPAGAPRPQQPGPEIKRQHNHSGRRSGSAPGGPVRNMSATSSRNNSRRGERGEGDGGDREYEAYRKKFKTGRLYQIVRKQIMRNKRRRGRAEYVTHLKKIYNSIVPAGGASRPRELGTGASVTAYSYLGAMLTFDFLTPALLGMNASLLTCLVATMMCLTTLFAMGQNASFDVAAGLEPAPADWGPARLWQVFIRNNTLVGVPDTERYLVLWGAAGPAAMSRGQGYKYLSSVLISRSFWHLTLVGAATVVAAALVERRYGILRVAMIGGMMIISGVSLALLMAAPCDTILGPSCLAWGFLVWWMVDAAARMTLWPWNDRRKLFKTACMVKNWTNLLLMATTCLYLVICEASLGGSSSASAFGAALSSLMITPAIAPRWSKSITEAITVLLACLGVMLFWLIIPVAGARRVRSLTDEELNSCSFVSALQAQ